VEIEAKGVMAALFLAARRVKERIEVTVVMAEMVEAGTMVVMAETLGQVRVENGGDRSSGAVVRRRRPYRLPYHCLPTSITINSI
jgi:hypothetical protein